MSPPDKPALFSLTLSFFLCPSLSSSAYLLLSRTTPNILLTATTESKVHCSSTLLLCNRSINRSTFVCFRYSWSEQKHNQTSHLHPDPDSHTSTFPEQYWTQSHFIFCFLFSTILDPKWKISYFFSLLFCLSESRKERAIDFRWERANEWWRRGVWDLFSHLRNPLQTGCHISSARINMSAVKVLTVMIAVILFWLESEDLYSVYALGFVWIQTNRCAQTVFMCFAKLSLEEFLDLGSPLKSVGKSQHLSRPKQAGFMRVV